MLALLVTIDVESDMPQWRVEAETTLRNLQGLPRFHELCQRLGVRPTYLCTYPVATQPAGEVLVDLQQEGDCEIGTHLHPWTNPPFDTNENRLEATQPSRLGSSRMEAKLTTLTDALEARFGRPKSYRAGRFGFDGAGLQALERLGYVVDTSATPFCDWRAEGGVDWRHAPDVPYFPDRQQPDQRGQSRVLEVPVSIGWDRWLPERIGRAAANAPPQLRLRGILNNKWASLAKVRWLYPSLESTDTMNQLADVLAGRGIPFLNVFFHSSELWPGESPYCRTEADIDRYLDTLEGFFTHAIATLGAVPMTLAEFAEAYLADTPFDGEPTRC